MPCIVVCGFPCSGKSTRTEEIKQYLETQCKRSVTVISDHSIGVDRNLVYADSKQEKETRGTLKSAVQRHIGKEDVVILDSLNYIKGFRYELYCITKACQTPQCTVFCDSNREMVSLSNQERPLEERYTQEILDALVMRFEPPNSNQRWDSPLFTVQRGDRLSGEQIVDALLNRKPPPPNMATQNQPLSSTNFLYELDKITQDAVGVIMAGQKTCVPGDEISIPGAKEKITVLRPLTLGELQRHRRQFIVYTKMHPVNDVNTLCNMFVQYLNKGLR
ncbi:protein KTI12 homolog [Mizuhopecten yessoensis]|uniref:protein KTI12 homolog n=1 Tax=Mizuhopecten yessoensis TaxID=6573 RepID=UPI000B45F38C|nr:protein KTI12 homolog [Mizuhopecten yessoensis]